MWRLRPLGQMPLSADAGGPSHEPREQEHTMETLIVPAPWELRGDSIIQVILSPSEKIRELVPPGYRIRSTRGWTVGALMWVHYTRSPVGPYEEFIFIPARVTVARRTGYYMSHIWVNSVASLESGRANWWIPKNLGDMTYERRGGGSEVRARLDESETPLVSARFSIPVAVPPMPMHSSAFPMPLIQEKEGKHLYVPYGGWGWVRPIRGSFTIESPRFVPVPPDGKRLPAIWLGNFRMRFPVGVPLD